MTASDAGGSALTSDVETHWRELVTAALLGTDRRDPPEAPGPVGDLVADAVRSSPAERMLADVAATAAVRRAAFLPAGPVALLAGPGVDARPICSPVAADRWHHIVSTWPVLEDEWMVTVIERGWRAAPQLVPAMLSRHRRDPIRWARSVVASGPLAEWLIEHGAVPAPSGPRLPTAQGLDAERLTTVPDIPISPDLEALCLQAGDDVAVALAEALAAGSLATAHRAVLVNLIARIDAGSLAGIATALEGLDPMATNFGLAASLADLARTRSAMLVELS